MAGRCQTLDTPFFFELCTVAGGFANFQFLDHIALLHGKPLAKHDTADTDGRKVSTT